MSSTTATWSPSSPQLRLALRCRNCKESRAVLVRARTRKLDCRHVRLLSVARSRSNGPERRRDGVSRIVVDSTAGADTFSGWSDSDHVEDSIDSKRSGWFGGINLLCFAQTDAVTYFLGWILCAYFVFNSWIEEKRKIYLIFLLVKRQNLCNIKWNSVYKIKIMVSLLTYDHPLKALPFSRFIQP